MKTIKLIWIVIIILTIVTSCSNKIEEYTITGQVAKTLYPESNTITVLIGKTTIQIPFYMDSPDYCDTLPDFPVTVIPTEDADVTVGEYTILEKLKGIYFKAAIDLKYLNKYDLSIILPDGKEFHSSCFLPDSFSIIAPEDNDTFSLSSITTIWSISDSAESYVINVAPCDSSNNARGWSASIGDTSAIIPDSAFMDSLNNYIEGDYSVCISAINGSWHKSSADLFLNGGNIDGAWGVYGAVVYSKPVIIKLH